MECHRRPTLALQKFSEGHAIGPGFVLHRRHGACRDACKRELQTFGQSILLPGIRSRGVRVAGCLTYQETSICQAKYNVSFCFVSYAESKAGWPWASAWFCLGSTAAWQSCHCVASFVGVKVFILCITDLPSQQQPRRPLLSFCFFR